MKWQGAAASRSLRNMNTMKHGNTPQHTSGERVHWERWRGTFRASAVATLRGPARQKHSSMVLSDTPISLSLAAIHGSTGVKSLILFALRARSPAHCALQQISVLNTALVLSLVLLALCPLLLSSYNVYCSTAHFHYERTLCSFKNV